MAEEKKCTGRCELCSLNQRSYCAAQKMFYLEQDIEVIKALLRKRDDTISTIVAKDNIIIEEE